MRHECGASGGVGERPQVEIDRAFSVAGIAVAAREVATQQGEEHSRRKEPRDRERRPYETPARGWTVVEAHAVDETQMRHAAGVTDGERLRDTTAHVVSNDAGAFDAKVVEQRDHSFGVRADVDGACEGPIAASESEEVDDDQPVPGRHERDDIDPEMARRRETVEEQNGYAGAARSGGVVVDPRAAEIEKLTAHAEPCW